MPQLLGYVMSKPDIAVKAHILVPSDLYGPLSEKLISAGLLEPLSLEEIEKEMKGAREKIDLIEKARRIYDFLNSLIEQTIEVEIREPPYDIDGTLYKLLKSLEEVYNGARSLIDESKALESRAKVISALRRLAEDVLRTFPDGDISLLDYEGDYIVVKTAIVDSEGAALLRGRAVKVLAEISIDEKRALIAAVLDKDSYHELKSRLSELELRAKYEGARLVDLLNTLDKELGEVLDRAAMLKRRAEEIALGKTHELALIKVLADLLDSKLAFFRAALESKYTSLLSGWVPSSKKGVLEEIAKQHSGLVHFEEGEEPPVDFNNPKPFKPFEIFTELIGYPSPRERDPTPLLTYLFLAFFSLMLADVGYAIGLVIGSRLVLPYFVENKETLRRLQRIAMVSAAVAAVAGVLSGSIFGSLLGEQVSAVFKPVLPSLPPRLSDLQGVGAVIMSYIKLSLLIGYFVIIFAHFVAFLKWAAFRNVPGAAIELVLVLITVISPSVISSKLPVNVEVIPLRQFIPLSLLEYATYAMLIAYIGLKLYTDKALGLMLWIFDVLGIMADILSFVRIAGIALGSALMAELINGLVYYALQWGSGIHVVIGIAVGIALSAILHLFNLALSSLGPFVHSLRLIMYEVSMKFYEGSGHRIRPQGWRATLVRLGPS